MLVSCCEYIGALRGWCVKMQFIVMVWCGVCGVCVVCVVMGQLGSYGNKKPIFDHISLVLPLAAGNKTTCNWRRSGTNRSNIINYEYLDATLKFCRFPENDKKEKRNAASKQ